MVIANPSAASDEGMRLGYAYVRALENDRLWAREQSRYEAVKEAPAIAQSALLPAVSVAASSSRGDRATLADGARPDQRVDRTYRQDVQRLQIRQALINRESLYRLNVAELDAEIGALQREQARQDVAKRLTEAYFSLLIAQEQVTLAEKEVGAIQAQLLQAEKLRTGGIATLTDVYEAQARLDRARAQLIEAVSVTEVRSRQLSLIVGEPVSRLPALRPDAKFALPEPSNVNHWAQAAAKDAPAVLSRHAQTAREGQDVERVRSQHWPVLDLVASHERSSNTDTGYRYDRSSRIGVELTMPIYAGGRVDASIREALSRKQFAEDDLQLAEKTAEVEATTAYLQVVNSLGRIQANQQAIASGEVALTAAQKSYSVAYRSFVDVLNAEQALFRSRFELLRAKIDFILAVTRLNAAVGSLDASLIEKLDSWLEQT